MKLLPLLAAFAFLPVAIACADPIYDAPVKDIDGKAASLAPYKGQVMLVVNVASKCGNTPQYAALEGAFEKYKDRGLVVLGFP